VSRYMKDLLTMSPSFCIELQVVQSVYFSVESAKHNKYTIICIWLYLYENRGSILTYIGTYLLVLVLSYVITRLYRYATCTSSPTYLLVNRLSSLRTCGVSSVSYLCSR